MSPPDAGDDDPVADAPSDPDSGDDDTDAPPATDPAPDASDGEQSPNDRGRDGDADDPTAGADRPASRGETEPTRTDRSTVPTGGSGPPAVENGGRTDGADGARRGDGRRVGRSDRESGPAPAAGSEAARDAASESDEWVSFAYDVVSSVGAVVAVGFLLFAVSGVWPPMVAVTSQSMTPHMKVGDLVFVMEEERFPGEGAHGDTGVVTFRAGARASVEYAKFGRPGDVIVYQRDGRSEPTMIIHRAMFWVNESENWYDEADRQAVGRYDECGDTPEEALPNCPAPHAGFITKGDANERYDQVGSPPLSSPVKPEWVVGTAEVSVPKLGCIRLRSEGCADGLLGFATADARGSEFERPRPGNVTTSPGD